MYLAVGSLFWVYFELFLTEFCELGNFHNKASLLQDVQFCFDILFDISYHFSAISVIIV